jgi:2-iminobutanoate/2-iminopropanoate deaminase
MRLPSSLRMSKRAIHTDSAPAAIGPYSQAIASGQLLFVSGQIALSPESGELVGGGIEAETRRVMENLGGILAAAGSSFDQVVKTTIYLVDMNDFAAVNATYGSYFGDRPPARATIQVAALPRGARVEVDAVAHIP